MTVTEGTLPVGPTTKLLDTTVVTQVSTLDAHREAVFIADPETLAARAKVTNTVPAATDYGVVTRSVPGDFWLDVAMGNISGTTGVNKFGRNSDVAQNGTEEIWDGSAAYVFPATALMTKISQTTDQSTMRGKVIEVQGLDASWNLSVQNATLDATLTTNAVTLDPALIRVFRMKVLANVVTTSPIRVHNTAENQDYAIIDTGNNQTLMAIYTVPNGKTAYMTHYYANLNAAAAIGPTACTILLWARDNDNSYEKQLKSALGLDPDASSHFLHPFTPYQKFTQKTDLFVTASPTGKAADVSAGFDLILVDN